MSLMEEKVDSKLMLKYVALHRMMLIMYQHVHWGTKGTAYYADHLLFERIYNKISEEIDGIAEKAVGLSSELSICPIETTTSALELLKNIFPKFNISGDPHEFVEDMLIMENIFLEQNEKLYNKLEEEGSLTLGLDDLLTSIHSSHEENMYLLKQRYKVQSISERQIEYKEEESEDEQS